MNTGVVLFSCIGAMDGETSFSIPGAIPISRTIEEVASRLSEFSDEGVEHCTIILHPFTRAGVEKLGRVVE
jgi:hypothetical protein